MIVDMELTQAARNDDALVGVDRAALIFAATAGVITMFSAEGKWSMGSTFFGVLLAIVVLAFHRSSPDPWTVRKILIQVAFGFTLVICVLVIIAYPLQVATGDDLLNSSLFVGLFLFGLGLLLPFFEPKIAGLLDLLIVPGRRGHGGPEVDADPKQYEESDSPEGGSTNNS